VLERYSSLRAREGHALVDLSESQTPMSAWYAIWGTILVLIQVGLAALILVEMMF
jgi:hypothetical protein